MYVVGASTMNGTTTIATTVQDVSNTFRDRVRSLYTLSGLDPHRREEISCDGDMFTVKYDASVGPDAVAKAQRATARAAGAARVRQHISLKPSARRVPCWVS